MYAPQRPPSSGNWRLEEWADAWITESEDGWMVRIHELANFDPIRAREIRASCTVLEIARAWKSKRALSEYAWGDWTM
jgi:hypothetical protein